MVENTPPSIKFVVFEGLIFMIFIGKRYGKLFLILDMQKQFFFMCKRVFPLSWMNSNFI